MKQTKAELRESNDELQKLYVYHKREIERLQTDLDDAERRLNTFEIANHNLEWDVQRRDNEIAKLKKYIADTALTSIIIQLVDANGRIAVTIQTPDLRNHRGNTHDTE